MKSSSEDLAQEVQFFDFFVKNGRAVLYPVYRGTYERNEGLTVEMHVGNSSHEFVDWLVMWVKDVRRSIDYLKERPDIDGERLALYCHSWGGKLMSAISAIEKRLKANICYLGGLQSMNTRERPLPQGDMFNYVTRVKAPTIMLSGRFDIVFSFETTARPMFQMLGTPDAQKRHFISESDHYIKRNDLIRESLDWLDKYLGPTK
jgi:dienelactone hydrolase